MSASSASALSKITPPTLHRVHANERLFDRLDAAGSHRAVWIQGPPGAGKTTLVASYLAARGIAPIWYRLDGGDADPATVFFYLSRVADAHGARAPLPLLTMEYRAALPLFARRFFRELFATTNAPVVVFDDYHEVDTSSALHACLPQALEEVPEGRQVVIISRMSPPGPFARLRLNGLIDIVEPDALRMTRGETLGLARERGSAVSAERVEAIARETQGWAAGVILMLEAGADIASMTPSTGAPLPEVLFDYFAGEILQRMTPSHQRLLAILALMPSMSVAAADKLTGSADAGALLEDLRKRNYFTTRDVATEARYRFHPMFRAFLLNGLTYHFSADELVAFQRHAALALDADGEPQAAVDLFQAAGAFAELAALIKRRANTLINEGRNDTLSAWLAILPAPLIESDAWLNYWAGSACLYRATEESYAAFKRAFDLFKQADDSTGQFLAWGGQAEAVRSNPIGDCADFDALLETMGELLERHPTIPPGPVMLRVALGMANGLWRRSNDRERIVLWQQRALGAARDCAIPGMAALVGFIFVVRDLSDGNYAEAREALAVLPDPLAADLPPVARLYGFMAWSAAIYERQMPGDCIAFVDKAIRCQEATGYGGWIFLLAFYAAIEAASCSDIETCGVWIARMRDYSGFLALDRGVHYHFVSAVYERLRGDHAAARTQANLAIARAHDFGWVTLETFPRLISAQLAIDSGDFDLASAELDWFDDIASRSTARSYHSSADLLRADLALSRGEDAVGAALLAEALRKAAVQGDRRIYLSADRVSHLLAYALRANIEPDYARVLIRCAGLPAPDPFDGSWPWPIRIMTFGGLSIERDGVPLTFSGKTPKRLIMLLKAIAAYGGRNVPEDKLMDAVWPEEEGDAAHSALQIAIHRLRKLLGDAEAVTVSGGCVSLAPGRCWLDLWAFNHLSTRAAAADNAEALEQTLALYRGDFLAGDDDLYWTAYRRDQTRGRFVRIVTTMAEAQTAAHDDAGAVALYERGLAIIPRAEAFHQGLMRCHIQRRDAAAGLAVYERLQSVMRDDATLAPAPASEALHRQLHAL